MSLPWGRRRNRSWERALLVLTRLRLRVPRLSRTGAKHRRCPRGAGAARRGYLLFYLVNAAAPPPGQHRVTEGKAAALSCTSRTPSHAPPLSSPQTCPRRLDRGVAGIGGPGAREGGEPGGLVPLAICSRQGLGGQRDARRHV